MSHKERFLYALQHIDSDVLNSEYQAALYILTSDERYWSKIQPFVESDAIKFREMFVSVRFHEPYMTLATLACHLFDGSFPGDRVIAPIELVRLDEVHFNVALMALQIRRSGVQMETLETISQRGEA